MSKQKNFPWLLDFWTMLWPNFGIGGRLHQRNNLAALEKWAKQYINQRFEEDQEWKDLTK